MPTGTCAKLCKRCACWYDLVRICYSIEETVRTVRPPRSPILGERAVRGTIRRCLAVTGVRRICITKSHRQITIKQPKQYTKQSRPNAVCITPHNVTPNSCHCFKAYRVHDRRCGCAYVPDAAVPCTAYCSSDSGTTGHQIRLVSIERHQRRVAPSMPAISSESASTEWPTAE